MSMPRRDSDAIAIPVALVRRIVLVAAAVALVGTLLAVALQQQDAIGGVFARGLAAQIDANRYQAVFLISGQIYFGHAQLRDNETLLLTDVFYLASATPENPRGQLLKRGSEVHGPTEPMIVPARQVLFIENLRDDGEVVAAIRRFRSGEQPQPAQPRPATQAPQQTLPQATATATPSPSPTR